MLLQVFQGENNIGYFLLLPKLVDLLLFITVYGNVCKFKITYMLAVQL